MFKTEVKCLRLDTGETLISHVKEGWGVYNLYEPKVLIQEYDETNSRLDVNLGVWCPYAEKYEFKLKKKTVVAIFKPRYNLERNYLNSLARIGQ